MKRWNRDAPARGDFPDFFSSRRNLILTIIIYKIEVLNNNVHVDDRFITNNKFISRIRSHRPTNNLTKAIERCSA